MQFKPGERLQQLQYFPAYIINICDCCTGDCDELRHASLQCIEKYGGGDPGRAACEKAITAYKACKDRAARAKSEERSEAFWEGMNFYTL